MLNRTRLTVDEASLIARYLNVTKKIPDASGYQWIPIQYHSGEGGIMHKGPADSMWGFLDADSAARYRFIDTSIATFFTKNYASDQFKKVRDGYEIIGDKLKTQFKEEAYQWSKLAGTPEVGMFAKTKEKESKDFEIDLLIMDVCTATSEALSKSKESKSEIITPSELADVMTILSKVRALEGAVPAEAQKLVNFEEKLKANGVVLKRLYNLTSQLPKPVPGYDATKPWPPF